MLIRTYSATLQGLKANLIEIEADSMRGKPGLTIIGLPEKSLEEARERITNSLSFCHIRLKCKKTIVNLAPADLRKTGSNLELGIAIALWELTIGQQYTQAGDIFFGELTLDGHLRQIKGALPLVHFAQKSGCRRVFIPAANQAEVSLISGLEIYPLKHLNDLIDFYLQRQVLQPLQSRKYQPSPAQSETDFSHIVGQTVAKRCLEIAAAGGHNLLLSGVPGAGKSLLASALPSILPPLTHSEAIEITAIYSVCGLVGDRGFISTRPYRSPHHTISAIGLAGGSSHLLPGELSLAHHGVLFLDELGEFRRDALEILRQPLETGIITISRAAGHVVYPANVTLVAATNPCPCGYLGSRQRACTCSAQEIARYKRKLSGPILDRLDMQIFVPEVDLATLTKNASLPMENSATIRARVIRARVRQAKRWSKLGFTTNHSLSSAQIKAFVPLTLAAQQILQKAAQKWQLSARSYFKLIKVARTIADLQELETDIITPDHIAESLQYRQLH